MAVGAGEIGLAHQFGAARGVRLRQPRRGESIGDQRFGGARRYARDVVAASYFAVAGWRCFFRMAAA